MRDDRTARTLGKLNDKPLVICDTGHNVAGWKFLSQQIENNHAHTDISSSEWWTTKMCQVYWSCFLKQTQPTTGHKPQQRGL